MCFLSLSGSLLLVSTVFTQHGSQVEVSGRIIWMGPDHPGAPSTFHTVTSCRTAFSSVFPTKSTAIRGPAGEDVRDPSIHPSVKVAAAKERVAKLQWPSWKASRSRGRDGAGCPPASVGSNPGGSHQRSGERVRVFLGESAFSFGRAGFETCHSVGEHRGFREVAGQIPEVVRISQILTQAAQEWQQMIPVHICTPLLQWPTW